VDETCPCVPDWSVETNPEVSKASLVEEGTQHGYHHRSGDTTLAGHEADKLNLSVDEKEDRFQHDNMSLYVGHSSIRTPSQTQEGILLLHVSMASVHTTD
jgi:hypothetical protein